MLPVAVRRRWPPSSSGSADLQPWVDVNFSTPALFDTAMTAEYWSQLGVTTLVWLWIPLALGLRAVLRAEVK